MTAANDYVFALHRDFTDRTGGKKAATVESTVGDYHLDVALCKQLLNDNDWGASAARRCASLRGGQSNVGVALAVEALRRHCVRELVSNILGIVNKAAPRPVPLHHVIELLTGWILHERNDPAHDACVLTLQNAAGESMTADGMYTVLFPRSMRRPFVLPFDVGAEVVSKKTPEVKLSLTKLVNSWRGEFTSSSTTPQEHELDDFLLVATAEHVLDVLIPSPDLTPRGSSTAVFVRMLKWCGDKTAAVATTAQITAAVRAAKSTFFESTLSVATSQKQVVSFAQTQATIGGEVVETVEISCGSLRCPMLLRAWNKMKALYEANNPEDESCEFFPSRLLIVLLRYASLSGAAVQNVDQTAGFHAAVPPRIYAKLRSTLNTVVEGFASPMNSTSTLFCSLFPDCDSYFGSLGSFFQLSMRRDFPKGVSMTCNPPYSIIVMTRVAEQLTQLFADAQVLRVPLQVFIVVCNWSVVGGESGKKIIDSLHNHPACVRHVSLPPERAPFQDGHAFVLNRPFFTLGTNTEVFFLQNEVAHSMWPSHRDQGFSAVIQEWQTLNFDETRNKRQRDQ